MNKWKLIKITVYVHRQAIQRNIHVSSASNVWSDFVCLYKYSDNGGGCMSNEVRWTLCSNDDHKAAVKWQTFQQKTFESFINVASYFCI